MGPEGSVIVSRCWEGDGNCGRDDAGKKMPLAQAGGKKRLNPDSGLGNDRKGTSLGEPPPWIQSAP